MTSSSSKRSVLVAQDQKFIPFSKTQPTEKNEASIVKGCIETICGKCLTGQSLSMHLSIIHSNLIDYVNGCFYNSTKERNIYHVNDDSKDYIIPEAITEILEPHVKIVTKETLSAAKYNEDYETIFLGSMINQIVIEGFNLSLDKDYYSFFGPPLNPSFIINRKILVNEKANWNFDFILANPEDEFVKILSGQARKLFYEYPTSVLHGPESVYPLNKFKYLSLLNKETVDFRFNLCVKLLYYYLMIPYNYDARDDDETPFKGRIISEREREIGLFYSRANEARPDSEDLGLSQIIERRKNLCCIVLISFYSQGLRLMTTNTLYRDFFYLHLFIITTDYAAVLEKLDQIYNDKSSWIELREEILAVIREKYQIVKKPAQTEEIELSEMKQEKE